MRERMKEHILIIEDDPDVSQTLLNYFYIWGYNVWSALTGSDALALCQREPPHLILLDTTLPDMDGYELCRLLRNDPQTRRSLIIALLPPGASYDRALELAHDHMIKPLDIEELKLRVRSALARAKKENIGQDTSPPGK